MEFRQDGRLIYDVDNICMVCELSEPCPESGHVEHSAVDIGSKNWDKAMEHGRLIVGVPNMLKVCRLLVQGEDEWNGTLVDEAIDLAREILKEVA